MDAQAANGADRGLKKRRRRTVELEIDENGVITLPPQLLAHLEAEEGVEAQAEVRRLGGRRLQISKRKSQTDPNQSAEFAPGED
jgi:hypothetical protein